jgi:hypothetical protein
LKYWLSHKVYNLFLQTEKTSPTVGI